MLLKSQVSKKKFKRTNVLKELRYYHYWNQIRVFCICFIKFYEFYLYMSKTILGNIVQNEALQYIIFLVLDKAYIQLNATETLYNLSLAGY